MAQSLCRSVWHFLINQNILLPRTQPSCSPLFAEMSWKFKDHIKHIHESLKQVYYNCWNFEATKMSFNLWLIKQIVLYLCNWMLFLHRKKWVMELGKDRIFRRHRTWCLGDTQWIWLWIAKWMKFIWAGYIFFGLHLQCTQEKTNKLGESRMVSSWSEVLERGEWIGGIWDLEGSEAILYYITRVETHCYAFVKPKECETQS